MRDFEWFGLKLLEKAPLSKRVELRQDTFRGDYGSEGCCIYQRLGATREWEKLIKFLDWTLFHFATIVGIINTILFILNYTFGLSVTR